MSQTENYLNSETPLEWVYTSATLGVVYDNKQLAYFLHSAEPHNVVYYIDQATAQFVPPGQWVAPTLLISDYSTRCLIHHRIWQHANGPLPSPQPLASIDLKWNSATTHSPGTSVTVPLPVMSAATKFIDSLLATVNFVDIGAPDPNLNILNIPDNAIAIHYFRTPLTKESNLVWFESCSPQSYDIFYRRGCIFSGDVKAVRYRGLTVLDMANLELCSDSKPALFLEFAHPPESYFESTSDVTLTPLNYARFVSEFHDYELRSYARRSPVWFLSKAEPSPVKLTKAPVLKQKPRRTLNLNRKEVNE